MTFPELITQIGPRRMADGLNKPIGTIYSWSSYGKIPRLVWPDLIRVFPEVGMFELMRMEDEAKSNQGA